MLVALGAAGGFAYVYKLKADNAILKANQEKLETAVQEQQELLEVKEMEYQFIIEKSKELEEKFNRMKKERKERKTEPDKNKKTLPFNHKNSQKKDYGEIISLFKKRIE